MVPQKDIWTSNSHPAHHCSFQPAPAEAPARRIPWPPRAPSQNLKLSPQQPSFPQTRVFDHIVSLKSKHQEEQNKWFQNSLFPVMDLDRQRHSGMPTKSLEGIKTTKYQCCTQQIHTKPKSCELCWSLNTSLGFNHRIPGIWAEILPQRCKGQPSNDLPHWHCSYHKSNRGLSAANIAQNQSKPFQRKDSWEAGSDAKVARGLISAAGWLFGDPEGLQSIQPSTEGKPAEVGHG